MGKNFISSGYSIGSFRGLSDYLFLIVFWTEIFFGYNVRYIVRGRFGEIIVFFGIFSGVVIVVDRYIGMFD